MAAPGSRSSKAARCCAKLSRVLRAMSYNPEDVADFELDHAIDSCRYLLATEGEIVRTGQIDGNLKIKNSVCTRRNSSTNHGAGARFRTGTAKTSYLYGRDQREAPIREGWNKAHNPPPTTDEPPLLMQLRSIQAAGG